MYRTERRGRVDFDIKLLQIGLHYGTHFLKHHTPFLLQRNIVAEFVPNPQHFFTRKTP